MELEKDIETVEVYLASSDDQEIWRAFQRIIVELNSYKDQIENPDSER